MSAPGYTLTVDVDGATPAELARGIAAAEFVFAMAGTTAPAIVSAFGRREALMHQLDGIEPLTNSEQRLCDVWENAHTAALDAVCDGWDEPKPLSANLQFWDDRSLARFTSVTWHAAGRVLAAAAASENLMTKLSLAGSVLMLDGTRYRCIGADTRKDNYQLIKPGDHVMLQLVAVGDPLPVGSLR